MSDNTITTAIEKLKRADIITHHMSEIEAVINVREKDYPVHRVQDILVDVTGEPQNLDGVNDDVQRVFRLYMLKYLSINVLRANAGTRADAPRSLSSAINDTRRQAIEMTDQYFNGSWSFLRATEDAATQIKTPSSPKGTSVSKDTEIVRRVDGNPDTSKVRKAPRKRGVSRVSEIKKVCVDLTRGGQSREDVLAKIIKDFDIVKPVTAVTYFNDALREAGIPRQGRGEKK